MTNTANQPPSTAAASPDHRGPGVGWSSILLVLAPVLASLVLLGVGIARAVNAGTYDVLLAGALATIVTTAIAGLAATVRRATRLIAGGSDGVAGKLDPIADATHRSSELLARIDAHVHLSERAKQVAYRKQDREAVRQAIEEDLLAADYASARQLADEFERAFGYKHEAERFRDEIGRRIDDARGHEIGETTSRVDRLCEEERWSEAYTEADRLIGKYDGDMRVRLLRTRIEEKRQRRKVELVEQFHEARHRGDAEAGSDLLRRLDPYLTPEEGRQLEAEAREVLRGKLLSLKDRYSQAIHGRDFSEALRLGTIIRRDYPNSQLAKEVAQHEPRIRERAGLEPEEEPAPL